MSRALDNKTIRLRIFRDGMYALSLLIGAILLSQILFEAVPGDAARRALGPYASQQSVDALREDLGLNQPLADRMVGSLFSTLKMDLGSSLIDGRAVRPEVLDKFTLTFLLGLQGVLIAGVIAVLVLAIVHICPSTSFLLYFSRTPSALPSFLSAVFVALISAIWFPALIGFGRGLLPAPFLPSLVAAIYPASVLTTSLGSRFASLRTGAHYRTALAYGHGQGRLFINALLVPSLPGAMAIVITQLSLVLFAALVIEIVFSLPGLGTLMLTAIQGNDFPMLQGILIVNAMVFIFLHFISEALNPLLDPRIAT